MKSNGLLVFVPKYGIEGPVCLTSKGGGEDESATFILDEAKQTVTSRYVFSMTFY